MSGLLVGLLVMAILGAVIILLQALPAHGGNAFASLLGWLSAGRVQWSVVVIVVAVAVAVVRTLQVRKRDAAEQAIRYERAFLQTVIDGVPDPLMVIGTDYRVLLMNDAARGYLADGSSAAETALCHRVSHKSPVPCSGEDHPCPLGEVQRTCRPVTVIHEHIRGDGQKRVYELEASPLWKADGSLLGIIEASRDITERKRAEHALHEKKARLDYLAHHDLLTGLPNRLLFQDRLQQALFQAQRTGAHVAVLFIDLDRFKNINDSLGHAVGDALLKTVAQRLRETTRRADTVSRLGGDEFVVVLDPVKSVREVTFVAHKLLRGLSQPVPLAGCTVHPKASLGIAMYPEDALDVDGLMRCADMAMYRAKNRGGEGHEFYTVDMTDHAASLFQLEIELEQALADNALDLYYQPQRDLKTHRLVGAEALARWRHPRHGVLSAADFVPLAEERGLIAPLGVWALRTACTQNRLWQEAGHPPVSVCVNLSARQFREPDLVDNVTRLLDETALEPRYLELELTESCAMDDADASVQILSRLKQTGVTLAIDDFGTGYSSLSYLKRFPIQRLKIDKSLVRDVTSDPNDAAIAASTIALAKVMNLNVIAEGVETEEQSNFLRDHGCDQVQGFLYGHPVRANDFVGFFDGSGWLQ